MMKKTPTDLDEGTIRRIDWQELVPAVLLPRAFRVAVSFRVLWLATIGLLLTTIAALLINGIAGTSVQVSLENPDDSVLISRDGFQKKDFAREKIVNTNRIADLAGTGFSKDQSFRAESLHLPTLAQAFDSMLYPWKSLTDSVAQLLPLKKNFRMNILSFFWFLWVFGVSIVIGGAITRSAAIRLTIEQHERIGRVFEFMNKNWKSYCVSVLLPLVGMFFSFLIVWIAGKLFSVIVVNYLVALFFPLILLAGFCFSILGIGLLFGWPLLFAAVSVDGSDGFDAVSRAYSYVFQRPLQYLVYMILAVLIGAFGWFFVAWIIDLTVFLSVSAAGITLADFNPTQSVAAPIPVKIVFFWCWCMQLCKVGYLFGYFWTSSTLIYLILRRSVDGTPFDIVRTIPDETVPMMIPPIKTDAQGAPEMEKPNDLKTSQT